MTEVAMRLREETETEESPWEQANKPYRNNRSWDYICRDGSYINREAIDYTTVFGWYV